MAKRIGHLGNILFLGYKRNHALAFEEPPIKDIPHPNLFTDIMINGKTTHSKDGKEN